MTGKEENVVEKMTIKKEKTYLGFRLRSRKSPLRMTKTLFNLYVGNVVRA